MINKKIVFYTQVYFLDNALEYVKLLSNNNFDVHVIINLSNNQKKANVLDVDIDLSKHSGINLFNKVEKPWKLNKFAPYFEKCKSVSFAVFPSKKITSILSVSKEVKNYILDIRPDYIHLDEISNWHLFMLPFLLKKRKKIVLNIHDPKTHSGESDVSRSITRKLLFSVMTNFVVFSTHSKSLLAKQLTNSAKIEVLKLLPYTIYKSFLNKNIENKEKEYISFVGRISPYKGVDLFVEAIDLIHKKYPNQKFVIGGKTIKGYTPDFIESDKELLTIKNKFLSNDEISSLVYNSKIIVCPYKDATQSGVIMTAYALNIPVVVSNIGGLPEYVIKNNSGDVANELSASAIAISVCNILDQKKYQKMQKYLSDNNLGKSYKIDNLEALKNVYV